MKAQNQVNALNAVLPAAPAAPGADPKTVVQASLQQAMENVVGKIRDLGDSAPLTEFEKLACCLCKGVGFRAALDPIRNEYRISLKSPCHVYVKGGRVHVMRLVPRA